MRLLQLFAKLASLVNQKAVAVGWVIGGLAGQLVMAAATGACRICTRQLGIKSWLGCHSQLMTAHGVVIYDNAIAECLVGPREGARSGQTHRPQQRSWSYRSVAAVCALVDCRTPEVPDS
jgi:hypothetical protein